MKFKSTLRELRKMQGYTQLQLAKKLDVTDQCIRDWENRGSEPNYETLCRLAKIFDVTVGQLLGIEDL
ncbi:MAG: helix-turn-helix domain-containing protein [Firmicutes bacterium]|nr:helix-turn-helix domain-containing protein [Bacillota bacterium]